jgi:site-specific DNA-methyltransferase (adenine-specific)
MDTNQVLLKGNCLELLDSIDTNKINLVIADLPYGQTDNDWDIKIDLQELWKQLKRVCTNKCCYIFFTTTRFGFDLITSNPKWFRYDLVWNKVKPAGFLNAKKQPMRVHEMMYVFYDKLPTYNIDDNHKLVSSGNTGNTINGSCYSNPVLKRMRTVHEPRLPQSILNFETVNNKNKRFHPTQKPRELLEWLIKYYSNEGDTILDPTCGSGETLLAAMNLNRNCYGIELNETYYNTAKNRLDTFSKFKELIG